MSEFGGIMKDTLKFMGCMALFVVVMVIVLVFFIGVEVGRG